jgi:hypothetical protein
MFLVDTFLPQKNIVSIEVDSKPAYLLPLDENNIFMVQGLLGKTVIEIKDKMVRVTESPCQNKLCIKQGWIKNGNILCIPNRVMVSAGTKRHDRATSDAITE